MHDVGRLETGNSRHVIVGSAVAMRALNPGCRWRFDTSPEDPFLGFIQLDSDNKQET
jgi:hypothetical protein